MVQFLFPTYTWLVFPVVSINAEMKLTALHEMLYVGNMPLCPISPWLFRPLFPPRAQKVVSVDDGNALSVVDPTAFTAALALERDGQEKVINTWYTVQRTP